MFVMENPDRKKQKKKPTFCSVPNTSRAFNKWIGTISSDLINGKTPCFQTGLNRRNSMNCVLRKMFHVINNSRKLFKDSQ